METDTRKKKKGFRLIAWILAVLLVALVATVVFLCRDDLSLSGIRSKMQQIFGRTTLAQEYSYDGGDGCIVRVLEDSVAVVNPTGVKVYDAEGAMQYAWSLEMATPAVSSAGGYAVMYDVGGTSLAAFTSQKVTATVPADGKLIYAAVNEAGWFVACMAENTYTSSATVYNPDGTAVYKWYSADGYAAAATVTETGEAVAVAVYGAGGTTVVCLNLDSTDEVSRTVLEGTTVLDLWWSDADTLTAVTDSGVVILEKTGEITAEVPNETDRVIGYTRFHNGTAFVGSAYTGSDASVLWTVSDDGAVSGKTEITGQISRISAAGSYIALLCADEVFVYNSHVRPYAVYTGANGADTIQALSDGTVLVAGGYYAWLLDNTDRQQID